MLSVSSQNFPNTVVALLNKMCLSFVSTELYLSFERLVQLCPDKRSARMLNRRDGRLSIKRYFNAFTLE